ncbi:hypothetical protein [Candidatus Nanohalococcus occultus]|uniref:hypothetical protein n=1 Tax=Candidatus Nanohalococcus occultus TaxID=2978047 RepID=UPI0039E1239A
MSYEGNTDYLETAYDREQEKQQPAETALNEFVEESSGIMGLVLGNKNNNER